MEGGGVVPDSVMESVNKTVSNVEEVGTHLTHFLSLSDPDVLSQMPPLQRAQTLLLLARATSTLFTCTSTLPPSFSLFFSFFSCLNSFSILILGFLFGFCSFTVRLRCTGVHPDDHPVKSELVGLLILWIFLFDSMILSRGSLYFEAFNDGYCTFLFDIWVFLSLDFN